MEELKSFLRSAIQGEYEEDKVIESIVDEHGAQELEDLKEIDFTLIASIPGLKTVQYSKFKKAVNLKFFSPPPTTSTTSQASSQASPITQTHSLIHFNVPFEKFPASLKKLVSEKKRQTEQDKKTLVNFLFDEIYTIEKRPGKCFLERIAAEVVNRYPTSFREEYEDGKPIDTGSRKLVRKLEFKVHNANRLTRSNLFPNQDNGSTPKKRCGTKDRYGCVNFLPTNLPIDETTETQNAKKVWLIQEYLKISSERNNQTIKHYMKATYAFQRQIITQKETVAKIRKEWPFLFEVRVTHLKLRRYFSFCFYTPTIITLHLIK